MILVIKHLGCRGGANFTFIPGVDTLPGDFENTWEAEEEATLEVAEVELVSSLLQASPPGFCPSPGDDFVYHQDRKGSSTFYPTIYPPIFHLSSNSLDGV